jgi:hypothetical protein
MIAVMVASLACMFLLRPRVEPILHMFAAIGAGVMTLGLHRIYRQRFGDIEGDLGSLVRSLFGFDLPYPGTVPEWQLTATMLGLFVLFSAVSSALISQRDHLRGLGLALMITAGLGLTDPQFTLMLGAGYLVLLEATAGAPQDSVDAPAAPPPEPLEQIFKQVAARLALPEPVALEQAAGRVLSLRGERTLHGETGASARVAVHLRARDGKRGPTVELTIGVPGRDRADVELNMTPGGHKRPRQRPPPRVRVRVPARHPHRLPRPPPAPVARRRPVRVRPRSQAPRRRPPRRHHRPPDPRRLTVRHLLARAVPAAASPAR